LHRLRRRPLGENREFILYELLCRNVFPGYGECSLYKLRCGYVHGGIWEFELQKLRCWHVLAGNRERIECILRNLRSWVILGGDECGLRELRGGSILCGASQSSVHELCCWHVLAGNRERIEYILRNLRSWVILGGKECGLRELRGGSILCEVWEFNLHELCRRHVLIGNRERVEYILRNLRCWVIFSGDECGLRELRGGNILCGVWEFNLLELRCW
jgi:hypothetical protein